MFCHHAKFQLWEVIVVCCLGWQLKQMNYMGLVQKFHERHTRLCTHNHTYTLGYVLNIYIIFQIIWI